MNRRRVCVSAGRHSTPRFVLMDDTHNTHTPATGCSHPTPRHKRLHHEITAAITKKCSAAPSLPIPARQPHENSHPGDTRVLSALRPGVAHRTRAVAIRRHQPGVSQPRPQPVTGGWGHRRQSTRAAAARTHGVQRYTRRRGLTAPFRDTAAAAAIAPTLAPEPARCTMATGLRDTGMGAALNRTVCDSACSALAAGGRGAPLSVSAAVCLVNT